MSSGKEVKSVIHCRAIHLFCFVLMLFMLFVNSIGCKKKKETVEDTVFQKIRVVTTERKTIEITNPEIDYSSDQSPEDTESFGIRVQEKDDATIVPWDTIKHIDITADGKRLLATITMHDGETVRAQLAQDTNKGLSGLTDSKGMSGLIGSNEVSFHLRELQRIEVIQ